MENDRFLYKPCNSFTLSYCIQRVELLLHISVSRVVDD